MVPPKPVKGSCEGTFVGWGTGSDGKSRTVAIQIVPTGKSSKVSLNVPNSTKGKTSPVSYVAKVADKLKIGDTVKIGYSSLGGQTWMTSLSPGGSSSKSKSRSGGDTAASEAFTFVSSRKVKTSGGMRVSLVARKGSITWTFQLPAETPAAADAKTSSYNGDEGTADTESDKPATLSAQVAEFKSGDLVALGYKTVNYKFVLESIAPYRMSATGRLLKKGKRGIRGVIYNAVFIRTAKQSLALIVPTTTAAGSKTNAAELASALETIKEGQQVELTYRKQSGVLWLDGITPATAETTSSTR